MTNIVYIGTSLDGYIAGPEGSLDWLETVPNPGDDDLGWSGFMARVDAVVMGRATFETVLRFGLGWHYPIPGIVLSSTLTTVPEPFRDHVTLTKGAPHEIVRAAARRGLRNLYIDGGKTIQGFLREDLIDEIIITEIPILLGGGERLFGTHPKPLVFELLGTEVLLGQMVKRHYRRKRG